MRRILVVGLLVLASSNLQGQMRQSFGVGTALPGSCLYGDVFLLTSSTTLDIRVCNNSNQWTGSGTAVTINSGVPQGGIIFVASGSCPTSFTEVSGLNGRMVRGTISANGDVGGTGGSDSVTPTFTGDSVVSSAVSAGTPAGTNQALTFTGSAWTPPAISWPAGVPTNAAVTAGTPAGTNAASATSGNCAATNIAAGTGSTTACKATAPNLTVSAQTFTGSALGTHTHTISWPAGVPTIATFTPAGTINTPTFTGSALGTHTHTTTATGTISAIDNKSAFIKLIGCSKD